MSPNNIYLWKNSFGSGASESSPSLPFSESKSETDLARENELLRAEIDYLRRRETILKRK